MVHESPDAGNVEFQELRNQVMQSLSQAKAAIRSKETADARTAEANEIVHHAQEAAYQADVKRHAAEVAAQVCCWI